MKKILEIDEEVLKPFLLSYNEMKSNILMKLKESNKDYKNILKEKEQILDKFPNLRNIIEFDSIKALSKEEAQGFVKLQNLLLWQHSIEQEELYLKGIETGYLIFKKIGLIKD